MDAEMQVVDFLNSRGLGAVAYYDVPANRPESFVVVELSGGADSDLVVRTPLFDVQCWAPTRPAAASLASDVKGALASMPGELPSCFHVNVTSTYRDRDMDSGTPRYHVVCEITFNV